MQSKDEQQAPFPRLYHQLSRKGLPFQLLFVLLWYMVLVSKNSDLVCSVNRVIDWNVFYPALPFAFNSTFNTLAAVKPCKTMRCFCSTVFTKILGTTQSSSSEAYWKRNKDAHCISSIAVSLQIFYFWGPNPQIQDAPAAGGITCLQAGVGWCCTRGQLSTEQRAALGQHTATRPAASFLLPTLWQQAKPHVFYSGWWCLCRYWSNSSHIIALLFWAGDSEPKLLAKVSVFWCSLGNVLSF